jgi:hypothetical protein
MTTPPGATSSVLGARPTGDGAKKISAEQAEGAQRFLKDFSVAQSQKPL